VRTATGAQASLTKTGYVTVKRTVKVASIGYSTANRGKDLVITMRIVNWAGIAVAGATVKANIYRGSALAKSFTTTSNLDGTLTYKLKNAVGCYNTVVTLVSSTNHEWNGLTPANNSCN
jgi:hypothetical protein